MTPILYGIKNCDACRDARRWLDQIGVNYEWVDLRANGLTRGQLHGWRDTLDASALINKRSRTWREFDERQRKTAESDPVAALVEHPMLVKRPVLETSRYTLAGFSAERFRAALAGAS